MSAGFEYLTIIFYGPDGKIKPHLKQESPKAGTVYLPVFVTFYWAMRRFLKRPERNFRVFYLP